MNACPSSKGSDQTAIAFGSKDQSVGSNTASLLADCHSPDVLPAETTPEKNKKRPHKIDRKTRGEAKDFEFFFIETPDAKSFRK